MRADVARAAAASEASLRTPSNVSSGLPQGLALTVLIAGQHIRQVRFEDRWPEDPRPDPKNFGVSKELTLELWDFRVSVDDLDWSRLPTFRTTRQDVDLKRCTVKIERSLTELPGGGYLFGPPKSEAGQRTVAVPAALERRGHHDRAARNATDGD